MTVFNDTYIPYEFKTKEECYRYICERASLIKKSLRLVEADNEHLCVRCPLSGDYLDISGTAQELAWLNNKLSMNRWYRTT